MNDFTQLQGCKDTAGELPGERNKWVRGRQIVSDLQVLQRNEKEWNLWYLISSLIKGPSNAGEYRTKLLLDRVR